MVCVDVSSHVPLPRLARHDVSAPRPTASAGAHVGTVSATTHPFLTTIDLSSGNCTVVPKNGVSFCGSPCATARERSLRRGLRIVICACASPPSFSLKKATCLAPGLPSEIVQATMRPLLGIVIRPRVAPTFA